MKKKLTIALTVLALALPATAQNWSIGVRSGAFVFGDFVERNLQPASGDPNAEPVRLTLTGETSPGLAVDIEHSFAPRWAVRAEGTFTHASLAVEDSSEESVSIPSGDLNVTTFTVPIVFRINPHGSFHFHLFGGPAYAIYEFEPPDRSAGIPIAGETRTAWGIATGGGVIWQIRQSFGIEGTLSDIVTRSPFDRSDLPPGPGIKLPKPHNVHTTVGIRYRF